MEIDAEPRPVGIWPSGCMTKTWSHSHSYVQATAYGFISPKRIVGAEYKSRGYCVNGSSADAFALYLDRLGTDKPRQVRCRTGQCLRWLNPRSEEGVRSDVRPFLW